MPWYVLVAHVIAGIAAVGVGLGLLALFATMLRDDPKSVLVGVATVFVVISIGIVVAWQLRVTVPPTTHPAEAPMEVLDGGIR